VSLMVASVISDETSIAKLPRRRGWI